MMSNPSRLSPTTLAAVAAAALLVGCATTTPPPNPDARNTAPAAAVGTVWEWRGTATPVGQYEPTVARTYQVRFMSDGIAHIEGDCNYARARYEITEGRIKLGPLSTTRQGCSLPSLGDVFIQDVARANGFYAQNGYLYLDLPAPSGQMKLEPAPFWPPYDWTW